MTLLIFFLYNSNNPGERVVKSRKKWNVSLRLFFRGRRKPFFFVLCWSINQIDQIRTQILQFFAGLGIKKIYDFLLGRNIYMPLQSFIYGCDSCEIESCFLAASPKTICKQWTTEWPALTCHFVIYRIQFKQRAIDERVLRDSGKAPAPAPEQLLLRLTKNGHGRRWSRVR